MMGILARVMSRILTPKMKGECEMRTLGNVILLLLLALGGFGFLLSYSLNLTRELAETKSQLARMQSEVQTFEARYQALAEEKNRLTELVSGLNSENAGLRTRVQSLETERLELAGQIETLQKQVALTREADPIIAWLVSTTTGRLATLFLLPAVPLSFGAVYIIARRKATASLKSREGDQATVQAVLTREEFHFIVERRRSRRSRCSPAGV